MIFAHISGPPLAPFPDNLTLPQVFLDGRLQHPTAHREREDIPCLINDKTGRKVYINELRSRTHHLAKSFKANWNLGDGQNIFIISPNHTDYPVCIWAAHRVGASVTTTTPDLTIDELVYQLKIVHPSLIITHGPGVPIVEEATKSIRLSGARIVVLGGGQETTGLSSVTVEDLIHNGKGLPEYKEQDLKPGEAKEKIAFLCFSSGTTGKPKAVALSHYNIICNVIQVATSHRYNEAYAPWEDQRSRPGDICSGVLPFYHIYGLVVNMHLILYARMTLVVTEKFDFAQMLKSIARYRITHLMIVPPQAVLICKHPLSKGADLSSVRFCMMAGAPVTAEITKQLLERLPGIQLGQAYGMTETSPTITMWPVTQKVGTLGSVGHIIAGTTIKVVKADSSLAMIGEPGELYIQGGQMAMGYYKNDAATKEVFVDGWVRTGDEVVLHSNGDLFVIDRIKEIIKVKGMQVAPAEVEGHLLDHPDIVDAAVIGIADNYAGEVPLAFVVLRPNLHEEIKNDNEGTERIRKSIFNHISAAVSQHKRPVGGIEFVGELPKNPTGKILRRILREKAARIVRPPRTKL